MHLKTLGSLQEGDMIKVSDDYYQVTGVEWWGRRDCRVFVCNERATDWQLPLEFDDVVELVRGAEEVWNDKD